MILLLLSALPAEEARARKISLIKVGGLQQDLTLDYGYDGAASESDGGSTDSSQHSFGESYNMGLLYAIYNPRLLHGNFHGSVRLDQDMSSGTQTAEQSSSRQNFLYRLSGTLMERASYPITFYSFSQFNRQQRAFSPSYDLLSDGFGATLSLGNKYLPASLSYSQTSSSTSGQSVDTESTGENFSLNASHSYRNLIQTGAGVSFTTSDTRSAGLGLISSASAAGFNLINTLKFDQQGRQRELRSRYLYHAETGTREFRSAELNEALTWELGKALSIGIGYDNRYENTDGQTSLGNSGSAWLQHRLFQSLFTRLEGHAQQTDFSAGSITGRGGSASFDYLKELPRESRLQLAYSFAYDVTDNELQDNVLFANNELQTVPDLPPFEFLLNNPDVIHDATGDIVVMTSDRNFTYQEGVDYTIRQDGLLTFVVIPEVPSAGPFPINQGTVLSVDYRYRVDPSVSYSATTQSAGATLSLFSNRHRIYARISNSNQELLSGQASSSRLNDTRLYNIGFATTLKHAGYGASYRRYEAAFNKSHDLDGYWRYARNFGSHRYSLNLRERFSLNEAAGTTGGSTHSNSISAAGVYQKVLMGRVNMKATGQFTDVRGAAPQDEVALGLDLSTRFGKSAVALASTVAWRFREGSSERQESVHLTYTRYF